MRISDWSSDVCSSDLPIKHSKSPLIHSFWLDALGLDASYRATHVTPDGLAGFFDERRADPDWRGCNITLPHKQAALDLVEDRRSEEHTSELQSLMRISYAVFCLKKQKQINKRQV